MTYVFQSGASYLYKACYNTICFTTVPLFKQDGLRCDTMRYDETRCDTTRCDTLQCAIIQQGICPYLLLLGRYAEMRTYTLERHRSVPKAGLHTTEKLIYLLFDYNVGLKPSGPALGLRCLVFSDIGPPSMVQK